ncbi:hypothetical protein EDC01DRAFT_729884 [Geopyxis carbonaria]|nr:hypothetical protein EDC01DRAFT_729884 [Geopyxis carbonaria]
MPGFPRPDAMEYSCPYCSGLDLSSTRPSCPGLASPPDCDIVPGDVTVLDDPAVTDFHNFVAEYSPEESMERARRYIARSQSRRRPRPLLPPLELPPPRLPPPYHEHIPGPAMTENHAMTDRHNFVATQEASNRLHEALMEQPRLSCREQARSQWSPPSFLTQSHRPPPSLSPPSWPSVESETPHAVRGDITSREQAEQSERRRLACAGPGLAAAAAATATAVPARKSTTATAAINSAVLELGAGQNSPGGVHGAHPAGGDTQERAQS